MNVPRYGPREADRETVPRATVRVGGSRRPLRDSPLLILLGIVLFLGALFGLLRVADRSTELAPDYLSEVVLYALSAACITMLVVLGFILARNIIKLWVERQRALPFRPLSRQARGRAARDDPDSGALGSIRRKRVDSKQRRALVFCPG